MRRCRHLDADRVARPHVALGNYDAHHASLANQIAVRILVQSRGHQALLEIVDLDAGIAQAGDFDNSAQANMQPCARRQGQQVDADKNGTLSAPRAIGPDKQDPYQLVAQCESAVSGGGNSSGSMQVNTGENLATGQTAEADYQSGGGIVSVALCYPGSFMTLSVTDPNGAVHASRQGGSPVVGHIDGPPGLWRAIVSAVNVPGGEPWAVAWSTNAVCGGEKVDTGTNVREILSNAQLSSGLANSGSTGITIQVQGVSSNSARIYYYSNLGGVEISWTIDFYAATPNLGAVLTQVSVKGINVTTQVVSKLTSYGDSISSIPTDYIVDRVYSCVGPEGNAMVIEGHR